MHARGCDDQLVGGILRHAVTQSMTVQGHMPIERQDSDLWMLIDQVEKRIGRLVIVDAATIGEPDSLPE